MVSTVAKTAILLALVAVVLAAYGDFTGKKYQAGSAQAKSSALWKKITSDQTSGDWPSAIGLGGLFIEDMNTSFDTDADELPYQFLGTSRRAKLIHSVGSVARIRFTPAKDSKYTGIFQGGNGFARCSLAKKYDGTTFAPGCGYKFVRDGMRSGNFLAMFSLKGQPSLNFMKNDFTNHVPDITDTATTAEKLLLAKFTTASQWPTMVGLSDLATYGQTGKKEASPAFPYELVLQPVDAVRSKYGDKDTQDHIAQLNSFGAKGQFTDFWTVMARPTKGGDLVNIGKIEIYDHFVASKFADEEMFFQHQRMDDDFKIHPEWK